jgi:hypothetical protein
MCDNEFVPVILFIVIMYLIFKKSAKDWNRLK